MPGRIAPPAPRAPPSSTRSSSTGTTPSFTSLKQNVGRIDVLGARVAAPGRRERAARSRTTRPRRQVVLDFVKERRPGSPGRAAHQQLQPRHARLAVGAHRSDAGQPGGACADDCRDHRVRGPARVQAASTSTSRRFRKARQPLLASFMCELRGRVPAARLVRVGIGAARRQAFDYKALGACTDRLILMAYDEHASESDAGPVASQAWFSDGVARRAARRALRAISSSPSATTGTTGSRAAHGARQPVVVPGGDARRRSSREGHAELTPDSLNPTFDYAGRALAGASRLGSSTP